MFQRIVLPAIFLLLCSTAKSQTQKANNSDTLSAQEMQGYMDYGARLYNVNNCSCPGVPKMDKDGHPLLPENHPSAKDFNNPKYWYWQNVGEDPRYGGYWEVKPEYMDSIPDGNGGWLKAAFWTIERWKREEKEKEQQQQMNWPQIDSTEVKPTL